MLYSVDVKILVCTGAETVIYWIVVKYTTDPDAAAPVEDEAAGLIMLIEVDETDIALDDSKFALVEETPLEEWLGGVALLGAVALLWI
jgi:hypothetical protein